MGTLAGHLLPGLALVFLGLWHTINTIKAYCTYGSTQFKSRFWYPFKCPFQILEQLELHLLLSISIFAMIVEITDFPSLAFSFKLQDVEHATMFLHLVIFAGFSLLAELCHLSENLSSVSGILATSVFGQELFLLHYHSADHVGLEGHYHWLLQIIVCVSLASAFLATSSPSNVPAALILSISVIFQGCWFINMGFMLWDPKFAPRGCFLDSANPSGGIFPKAMTCGTPEAGMRARALANLQFSWILSSILVFVACNFLTCGRSSNPGHLSSNYKQLQSKADDVHTAISA